MAPKPNVSYFKQVLNNVKGYPVLFQKEMKKARTYLSAYEYNRLNAWVKAKFDKSKITLD
ncbi:MAG: hypothetical protein VWZ86_01625 [Flavobacteriaceae bacterium]